MHSSPSRFSKDDVRGTFKARDAWWTVLLVDPLAAPAVRFLANHTRVTPNQLSLLAFVLGLGSAGAFLGAQYRWLVLGAVLFYLAFYVDCIDGKIARLKGTGSTWGQWLDFIFDRIRIFLCVLALIVGQYERTGQAVFLVVGMTAVFIECMRYINSSTSERLRQYMRARMSETLRGEGTNAKGTAADEPLPFIEDVLTENPDLDPEEVAASGNVVDLQQGFRSKFKFYNKFRHTLRRHRIRPHLWSGIEFQMFVCIVGPLTYQVLPMMIAAAGLLLVFEVILVYKLWLNVRDFDRAMAAHGGRSVADAPAK
ncbi:MAG: CDP-alcohol phosphatidyltransferase family protein [Streptosporangiales bacterium]|nr:CDP-alcohol phosphatidyltransferase family protein [Streptosporangiales bacterium]MBO0890184.1 CDP-alcohol phosphatidyltransferase family protein [Acidothermales bacterium]